MSLSCGPPLESSHIPEIIINTLHSRKWQSKSLWKPEMGCWRDFLEVRKHFAIFYMKLVTERKGRVGKGNSVSSNWHIIENTVPIFLTIN